MAADPQSAYAVRLELRRAELSLLERQDRSLSRARGTLAAAAILAAVCLDLRPLTVTLLGGAALAFFVLVVVHERLARRLARARRRVDFYEAALLRTGGDWAGRGEPGTRFLDPHHPFAADLDLFGPGSLFERLCAARTHAGQDRLAAWLREGSPVGEVRERQHAGAELGPRLDLREDLAGSAARPGAPSTPPRSRPGPPPLRNRSPKACV